jgi:hypothetical protein
MIATLASLLASVHLTAFVRLDPLDAAEDTRSGWLVV